MVVVALASGLGGYVIAINTVDLGRSVNQIERSTVQHGFQQDRLYDNVTMADVPLVSARLGSIASSNAVLFFQIPSEYSSSRTFFEIDLIKHEVQISVNTSLERASVSGSGKMLFSLFPIFVPVEFEEVNISVPDHKIREQWELAFEQTIAGQQFGELPLH